MGIEYSPASDQFITSGAWVFTDALLRVPSGDLTIVLHKTACSGKCTAQSVADFFHNDTTGHKSVHFIIGLDGEVIQLVHLKDGAGGNCCLQPGHDTYWDRLSSKYGNLNTCTISIEHVDQTADNSQAMPQVQIDASFSLIHWLVAQYSLNPVSQIKTHASMRPGDRARCPGPTYPMQKLLQSFTAPPVDSAHFDQEALDCWHSILPDVDSTTFIFDEWKKGWKEHNKQYGPPISHEYKTVHSNGKGLIAQEFAHARAEFDGKLVKWYSFSGGI